MEHQRLTLIVALVTLVATILLYVVVPKGLLPQQDTGVILGVTEPLKMFPSVLWCQAVHLNCRYRSDES